MAIEGMGKLTSEQLKQMHQNIQESPKQVEEAVKKKEDKQKLALALGALGAVGAAAVGIAMKVKKGKVADVADVAKDGADKLKKAVSNGIEITIGEKIPFDETIQKVKCGDKILDKETWSKFNAKLGDKDVIFEQVAYDSKIFDIVKDKETNKIIKAGKVSALSSSEKHIISPLKRTTSAENIVKTSKKAFDEAGNEVSETFKNGKLFSKQTTIKNTDGSKQIIVDYGQNSKRIIDIAKDGTRKEVFQGDRFRM